MLSEVEKYIIDNLYSEELEKGGNDNLIKPYLDHFYWEKLARSSIGVPNQRILVVGGRRKAWAIERITRRYKKYMLRMSLSLY